MAMFVGLTSVVGMFVFFVLGIIGMVRKSGKAKKSFIAWGVCLILLIASVSFSESTETEQAVTPEVKVEDKTEEEAQETEAVKEESKEVSEPKEEVVVEEPKEEEPQLTASQKNAIRQADSYLSMMAFSRSGLIEQLEFEGYSKEDATFAVDNVEVDWREQAVKSAENYNELMPMSRQGLIDQLVFEGHSREDADYAVGQIGL